MKLRTISIVLLISLFESLFLSKSVSLPIITVSCLLVYVPLLYLAKRTGSPSIFFFVLLLVWMRFITLPLIHYTKDTFTASGWTAIKEFDFSASSYIRLIVTDGLAILIIVSTCIIVRKFMPTKVSMLPGRQVGAPFIFGLDKRKVPIILFFFLVANYFLFEFSNSHQIGIAGIEPMPLPFKLAGIIYYYQKLIGPAILLYIIMNSKSKMVTIIPSLFLVFLSVMTLSRSTVAMWAVPVIYVAYVNNKSKLLALFTVLMVIIASMLANIGRNLMYVIDGDALGVDLSVGIVELFLTAGSNLDISDFVISAFSLISRLGGGQEMILGYQTVFPDIMYCMKLLGKIFTDIDFGVDYHSLVTLTHDFVPLEGTVAGISFSGYMLAFFNTSIYMFMLFAILSAAIINLNDSIRNKLLSLYLSERISNAVCFSLNFTFFAMFTISWYWLFVLLAAMVILVFNTFNIRRSPRFVAPTVSSVKSSLN